MPLDLLPPSPGAWIKEFSYVDMIKPLESERRFSDFVWSGPPRLEVSGPGLAHLLRMAY
jgi:hypothetical protein